MSAYTDFLAAKAQLANSHVAAMLGMPERAL